MKKFNLILIVFLSILLTNCKTKKNDEQVVKNQDIISSILEDETSYYYINAQEYPDKDSTLPIGVFDSGTGGLTVLEAIVNYDENQNETREKGKDGLADFNKESFIYLADQANMPYGSYPKENNLDLLKEHIIKDVQFLMGNKYYTDQNDKTVNIGKKPVKLFVIACNTATAHGKEYIENFLKKANLDIKVIGVIDAGSKGALEVLQKDEDAIIGVFATIATVGAKGYDKAIKENIELMGYTGNIEVFSQGGIGLSEAIDEDPDYYDKNLKKPRKEYQGPAIDSEDAKIDKTLAEVYNFDFTDNNMLCDSDNSDDCNILQLNSSENYARYHLVTLMEKIRLSGTKNKLKSLILGCTHYPYLTVEIDNILKEIYNYKDKNGTQIYRDFMVENVILIDPAINTAKEVHDYFKQEKLFNNTKNYSTRGEFYISVPNKHNPNNVIAENNRFPYDYKYGRKSNQIQEYIKAVPFSDENISNDVFQRLEKEVPTTFSLISDFRNNNPKVKK